MIEATPADGYVAATEVVAHLDLRDDLAAIVAPTLVISGAEDVACPPAVGRALADGIAGAEFAVPPRRRPPRQRRAPRRRHAT